MNFKLTLSLVTILLVGLIIVLLLPHPGDKKEITGADDVYKPMTITSITYSEGGTVKVKFEKKGSDWQIVEPVKGLADNFQVEQIAQALTSMKYKRRFEPETSGAQSLAGAIGDKKQIIEFKDDQGKAHSVELGSDQTGGGTYVLVDGDNKTIGLVDSTPRDLVNVMDPAETFRSRTVAKLDPSKIVKLEIVRQDTRNPDVKKRGLTESVTLVKKDNTWQMTSPTTARVDGAQIQSMVQALGELQAVKYYHKLTKADTGLEKGFMNISITAYEDPNAGATQPATAPASAPATTQAAALNAVTLQIGNDEIFGKKDSDVFACLADSPEIFTLPRQVLTALSKSRDSLRDHAPIPGMVQSTTYLTIADDKSKLIAQGYYTLGDFGKVLNWNLEGVPGVSGPMKADQGQIGQYLGTVADLRAINFADNPPNLADYGLDKPRLTIRMIMPDSSDVKRSREEVLLVGTPKPDLYEGKVTPVMRQGETNIFLVQKSDADKLATTAVKLRDRSVAEIEPTLVQKIEIGGPKATVGAAPPPPPATAPATASAPATAAATGTAPATASAPATAPAIPQTPGITMVRQGPVWVLHKGELTLTPDDQKIVNLLQRNFSPLRATNYLEDTLTGAPDVTVAVSVLEIALPQQETKPADSQPSPPPATTTASTKPATAPATAPAEKPMLSELIGPKPVTLPQKGEVRTYTLKAYKQEVSVTPAPDSVSLKWSKIDGATGYEIWISDMADERYEKIGTVSGDATEFSKSGLMAAFTAATAPATKTAPATATAPATTPATTAAATTPATSPATATAASGKTFKFQVRAVKGSTTSVVSNTVIAAVPPPPPTTAGATTAPTPPATMPASTVTTWKGIWDGQSPAWAFEISGALMDQLTTGIFTPTAPPAVQAPVAPEPNGMQPDEGFPGGGFPGGMPGGMPGGGLPPGMMPG